MVITGRVRSTTFRYKDLAEAQSSPLLPKAQTNVLFENTLVSHAPVMGVAVGGRCQGWRKRMEDEIRLAQSTQCALMVVLDGHRGEQAALFCAERLPATILQHATSVLACEGAMASPCATGEEVDATHAVEVDVGRDPRGTARRDVFIRAFSDVDTQLFEAQGGEEVYHAPARKGEEVAAAAAAAEEEEGEEEKEKEGKKEGGTLTWGKNQRKTNYENVGDNKNSNDVRNVPPRHFGTFMLPRVSGGAGDDVSGSTTSSPPSSGTTAIAVMVDAVYITVGSLGDCRAFLVERRADAPQVLPTENVPSSRSVLPTGFRIHEASVVHRLSNAKESLRLVQQFGPNVVLNGRVLGCLMVSRALGDFDVKFNMINAMRPSSLLKQSLCGVAPLDALQKPQPWDGEEGQWTSSLVVSNVPQTRIWRRGIIPPAPPAGWGAEDVVPYDLIVVGSDGAWELQDIACVVARVDRLLQPLLRSGPPPGGAPGSEEETAAAAAQKHFTSAIESALREAVSESLRKGVSSFCSPSAAVPGADNLSLAVMLLVG